MALDWLIALLALSGILTVLSTIVTVIVEAIHKVLALRSRGLRLMLRELYVQAVETPSDTVNEIRRTRREERKIEREARKFADSIATIPTKRRSGSSPNFLGTKFDALTVTQLIQQFAFTPEAQSLVELERSVIQRRLSHLVFHFERIGWGQTAVFRMRAKFISTFAALAFVLAANINIVQIYKHLASDKETYANTMAFLGAATDSREADTIDAQLESVRTDLAEIKRNVNSSDPAQREVAASELNDVQLQVQNIQSNVTRLQALGLPIGQDFFPFCRSSTSNMVDRLSEATPQTRASLDADCLEHADKGLLARVIMTRDGWFWVFSITGTIGLIGLGAPFWFSLFAKSAALSGRTSALSRLLQTNTSREPSVSSTKTLSARELSDVFLMTAGRVMIDDHDRPVGQAADDLNRGSEQGAVFSTGNRSKEETKADQIGYTNDSRRSAIRRSIGLRQGRRSGGDDAADS